MPQAKSSSSSQRGGGNSGSAKTSSSKGAGRQESLTRAVEQLVNRILKPLDLVVLTRERIQETLDEAAERGRVTRSDANELVAELVRRGREQRDDLLKDLEDLLERGRGQIGSATKRARQSERVDQLVRAADRARRSVGVGPSFPISDYDELTASQVNKHLSSLTPPELRRVREYEARHANRKSVLEAIERILR